MIFVGFTQYGAKKTKTFQICGQRCLVDERDQRRISDSLEVLGRLQ